MNFWETITGSDLTREWKAFEARAEALPADYGRRGNRSRFTSSPTRASRAAT